MNSEPPKFSVERLPNDPWEVRRTKQIVRAIIVAKQAKKWTTEELAERCNRFLDEPGAVKVSTLNGLFAGKRKTITATELEMFASVLHVDLLSLMYPVGEPVEVGPRGVMVSSEALVKIVLADIHLADNVILFEISRTQNLLDLRRGAHELLNEAVGAIGSLRRLGLENPESQYKIDSLRWKLQSVQRLVKAIDKGGDSASDLIPGEIAWMLTIDPERLSADLVLSGEKFLTAWSVGGYQLGSADE